MFMHDKYIPHKYDDLTFHKDIVKRMFSMNIDNAIPHLILYGPDGSGKKTIAKMFLENIFGSVVNQLTEIVYTINGSGNTTADIPIKQSIYHIVIEPNNNNFDRYLIQNVVTEYARRIPIDACNTSRTFKFVVINNVDNLSYYAQMSLRRTMETYSRICRFLMVCNSFSKLIDPLRSRCVCIRVPSPTKTEIIETVMNVCYKEKYIITMDQLTKLISMTNHNIRHVFWIIECLVNSVDMNMSYDNLIDKITSLICEGNLDNRDEIIKLMYNILITNISGSNIIQTILKKLLYDKTISNDNKLKLIKNASKYEHNMSMGRRDMIHLDAFIVNTILILS